MSLRSTVHAFEVSWLRRVATSVEACPVGTVMLTDPAPRIRDHNAVVLDPGSPTAEAVRSAADTAMSVAGLSHRRVYAHDPGQADLLAAGLRAAGYEVSDTVAMRFPPQLPPTSADRTVTIEQADADTAARWARRVNQHRRDAASDLLDEFAWIARRQHDLGVRFLIARVDRAMAGSVRIFPGDGVAQVEELDVLEAYRRGGIGRRLLAEAAALVSGHPLVFLTCDPDDWTTGWYRRLGFTPLGRQAGFLRPEPE